METPAPSAPPERLGRYEIREKLGSGDFGTVYRAYDPVMDREIALKVPREGLLETPTAVERFLREARAAARLRHPNIVPAHDAGSEDGRHYIASAFVPGRTLARVQAFHDGRPHPGMDRASGFFGIQGGTGTNRGGVQYRKTEIRDLGGTPARTGFTSTFDGRDPARWTIDGGVRGIRLGSRAERS